MNKKPKVVLDTNVLLVSISSKSRFHWIFQKLLFEDYELVVSNEIITEYEEVITKKYSKETATDVIRTLLLLPNVIKNDVYYRWSLINTDEDDNKFVDCAIASNAHYLVTNDNHFKRLKDIDFPYISILDVDGFNKLFIEE